MIEYDDTLFSSSEQVHEGQHSAAQSPAESFELEAEKRALDELFSLAQHYRTGKEYGELIKFITRFRAYSPFNALLIHIQKPGAKFVAPASRWLNQYHCKIKAGAQPLVILRPMGPVMFVFDVSDTEGGKVPTDVKDPFGVAEGRVGSELKRSVTNAVRDGVEVSTANLGSQQAGCIRTAETGRFLMYTYTKKRETMSIRVPLRYELIMSSNISSTAQYVTMVHELAHLYCGHLGTPDSRWWPDRLGLTPEVMEFEAESVAYLVCRRIGIKSPSEKYLSGYLESELQIPPISMQTVMKSAGLIEQMGTRKLSPRKST